MKLIDTIASWLVNIKLRKDRIENDTDSYLKRGNNGLYVWFLVFGAFFVFWALELYDDYGLLWVALIPIALFVLLIMGILVRESYKEQLNRKHSTPRLKLVGINLDFNERVLRRIYNSLVRYELLDENLTSFADFHYFFILDFEEHDSELHFICTQPQLKYILEKFKQFKNGLHLKTFERSEKVYHKGNLISAKTLSKKYSEFPPGDEFEGLIDSFFDFLGDY